MKVRKRNRIKKTLGSLQDALQNRRKLIISVKMRISSHFDFLSGYFSPQDFGSTHSVCPFFSQLSPFIPERSQHHVNPL